MNTILIFTTQTFQDIFVENFSIWLAGALAVQNQNPTLFTIENFNYTSLGQHNIDPQTVKACVFILPSYNDTMPNVLEYLEEIMSPKYFTAIKYQLMIIKIINKDLPCNYDDIFICPTKRFNKYLIDNQIIIQRNEEGTMKRFFQTYNTRIHEIINKIIH